MIVAELELTTITHDDIIRKWIEIKLVKTQRVDGHCTRHALHAGKRSAINSRSHSSPRNSRRHSNRPSQQTGATPNAASIATLALALAAGPMCGAD